MGAAMAPTHRCFNMRNPFARALVLAVSLLFLGGMMLKSDKIDVHQGILKTAKSAKQRVSEQRPLDGFHHHEDDAPILEKPDTQLSTPVPAVATSSNTSYPMTCDFDKTKLKEWQSRYNLATKFEYTKRYAKFTRHDIKRKSITSLGQNLVPDKMYVVDMNKNHQALTCPPPLEVPVTQSPLPGDADASDFMFGVSTTYQRFRDPQTSSLNEWTYWLTDGNGNSNGGKLILLLLGASDDELEDAYDRLVATGIDVDVFQSDSSMEMAVRYLTLVPTLYNHPERQGKKWLVICDDDTFFPSFNALVERFAEFDATKPMYIGTFSEDVNNLERHGSQAFGGAGVFLSEPMAEIITENYDSCKTPQKVQEANSGWGPQGDILLRKCIYENSETKLTYVHDLWQLDFMDDPAGFYESGMKPLSLHHYRGGTWHIAYPWHGTKISRICGEDCLMQRFRTSDDFIISNGYSIAYYPKGINFDLNQVERTMRPLPDDKGWNLDFKFGPQRDSMLKTGRKMSWELKEATTNDDGSVSQVYVRRRDDARWVTSSGQAMSDMDGIIELVWIQ